MGQPISVSLKNQSLEDAIWTLSDVVDIPISYSGSYIDTKIVDRDFDTIPLYKILDYLLDGTNNYYQYLDGQLFILNSYLSDLTLSGYIEDSETGERLIGAAIYNAPSYKGAVTNNFGFFSLKGDVRDTSATISYLGYEPYELSFRQVDDVQIIKLKPDNSLPQVVIKVSDSSKLTPELKSRKNVLEVFDLTKVTPVGGEQDIMRLIYQLPGATTGTDGLGGLHVRGGNADQNLIMLDGVQIYNPYHSFGLFSIFDNNTVSSVDYLKGAFPARFGGRLSSVLDVRLKDGNSKKFASNVTVGLLATKAMIEGPIIKDKLSFLLNARHTHFSPIFNNNDWRAKLLGSEESDLGYSFGDVVSKLTYTPSKKDRIYLSYYGGNDSYNKSVTEIDTFLVGIMPADTLLDKTVESQILDWGNKLIVGRWNHQFSNNLFSNLTLNYSNFKFLSNDFYEYSQDEYLNIQADTFSLESNYRSNIEKITGKLDFEYIPNTKHYLRSGITYADNKYTPGISILKDELDDVLPNDIDLNSKELNIYIEDEWAVSNALVVNVGLFSSIFNTENTSYFSIEPRLSMVWRLSDRLTLGGSANKVTQNLHVLSRAGSGFPTDLWVPSTDIVKPQSALLFDLSGDYTMLGVAEFSIGAFYKKMNNIISYREVLNYVTVGSSSLLTSENWQQNVTSGEGRSYGVELLAQRNMKSYSALVSYSLSKSDRRFDLVNNGIQYPFTFEHRHKLNITLSKELSKKWRLDLSWNYNSGSRINIPLSKWQYVREDGIPDFFYYDIGDKNSFQLPSYHRLDVSATYTKPLSYGELTFIVGVYNLYNRKNSYYINTEYSRQTDELSYKNVSIIPILPYFSMQLSIF